jgi:hypothetical protein
MWEPRRLTTLWASKAVTGIALLYLPQTPKFSTGSSISLQSGWKGGSMKLLMCKLILFFGITGFVGLNHRQNRLDHVLNFSIIDQQS